MKRILQKSGFSVLLALLFSTSGQGMEEDSSRTISMIKKIGKGFSNPLPQRVIERQDMEGIIQKVIKVEEPTPLKVELPNFFPREIWIEIMRHMRHNPKLALSQACKSLNNEVFSGNSLLVPVKNLKKTSDLEKILNNHSRIIQKLVFSRSPQENPSAALFDVHNFTAQNNFFSLAGMAFASFSFLLSFSRSTPPSIIDLSLLRILGEWENSTLKNHPSITALDFSNTSLWHSDVNTPEEKNIFSNLITGKVKNDLYTGVFGFTVFLDFTNATLSAGHINDLIGSENNLPNLKELILRHDKCFSILEITKAWEECNLKKLDLTGRELSYTTGISLAKTLPHKIQKLKEMKLILEDFKEAPDVTKEVHKQFKGILKKKFPLLTWVRP